MYVCCILICRKREIVNVVVALLAISFRPNLFPAPAMKSMRLEEKAVSRAAFFRPTHLDLCDQCEFFHMTVSYLYAPTLSMCSVMWGDAKQPASQSARLLATKNCLAIVTGCAFVTFTSRSSASAAIRKMHQSCTLEVREAVADRAVGGRSRTARPSVRRSRGCSSIVFCFL